MVSIGQSAHDNWRCGCANCINKLWLSSPGSCELVGYKCVYRLVILCGFHGGFRAVQKRLAVVFNFKITMKFGFFLYHGKACFNGTGVVLQCVWRRAICFFVVFDNSILHVSTFDSFVSSKPTFLGPVYFDTHVPIRRDRTACRLLPR